LFLLNHPMAKLSIIGFTLALLLVCSYADPLFLLSSQKIGDLSDNVFLDTQGVQSLLNDKILGSESAPNAVYVFNVKIQDKKYLENPSLLLKEVSQYSALKHHFKASGNTFSSLYVQGAFAGIFNEVIKTPFLLNHYRLLQLPLRDFSLEAVREFKSSTGGKNILNWNEGSLNDLKGLNNFFENHFNALAGLSNNFLIVLKFTDETESTFQALTQTSGRILEEEEAAPATPTTTVTATDNHIKISPEGFSGFVIAVILALFLYAAFQIMNSIKPPVGFNKVTLLIGKEH